ncbi:acyl-CoA dehydrogenase family protein [Streptomyces sp. NPDC093085]|uniref:acyl-CoA dehydrogenase family protein n=1 Tax=Streptomyces sp. NPDC093085 TaxID=3155068 RepID=UPI003440C108
MATVIRKTGTDVLDEVRKLIPRLRENAPVGEQNRWIPEENIKLLKDAGVWSMAVPQRFGGLDLPLADQVDILAEIASGDGSTGWVASLWSANTWIAQLYPDEAQAEIFDGGSVRVSGAFSPTGTLTPTEGGYLLNGSWKWNTGCRGAKFDGVAARLGQSDGDTPEIYYAMATLADLSIADDWHASAASATGSSMTTADNVFIPAHRVVKLSEALTGTTGSRSNTGATGRNYAFFAYILVQSVGAFIGMARGAYDLFLRRLPGRGITYTPWTEQSQSPVTHIQVATAANKIAAAEALSRRSIETLQEYADAGELPPVEVRAALRGQSGYAAELCREAVEVLYQASGASVIMKDVPFQRFYRDIHGLSQHAAMALNSNLEVHGRVLVGLDPATPFL